MSYGMFEDAAYRDIPVGEQRRHAKLDGAYAQITRQFGPFLRNAKTRDDYRSRLALIEHDIDSALAGHQLSSNDQNMVMAAVFAETQPDDNPGFMIPNGQDDSADDRRADKDSDVKLEHISRRRRADTHEHYKGEMPGMGGGTDSGAISQPQGMQPPAQPSLNTSPAPASPAQQKPPSTPTPPSSGGGANGAPSGAPSMGPTSTPPSNEPTLGPSSGRPNPGKVPGHGMPGASPIGQGQQGPSGFGGKMKQMFQKVPQIGNAMKDVMNAPAKNLFDSPNDFLNNRSVNNKIWDAAQTAGMEPRAFMAEHWDELMSLYENTHALMEGGGHAASTKKGHDRRTADWFGGDDGYDPVQGLNPGDQVVTTIDTTDDSTGQPVPQGTQGQVEDVNGDQITVSFDSGDATVDVQALQKTSKTAGWQWDPDAQSFKSRATSDFSCPCGQRVAGVGQHLCACGRTWNISSFMSQSKTGTGAPSFACREVKTDPKLVLANRKMAGTPESQLPPSRKKDLESDAQAAVEENCFDDGFDHKAAVASLENLRRRTAQSGVWPIISDKDVQKNWQALMGVVTDPTQVGALENPAYQTLIQDLYEEIVRRGLHTPDPSQNSGMADPTQMAGAPQMGIAPAQMGGQVGPQQVGDQGAGAGAPGAGAAPGGSAGGDPMAQALQQVQSPQQQTPSPGVMSAYREGLKLARDGFVPFEDEPVEVMAGWVLGLNKRIAEQVTDAYGKSRDVPDPYATKRDTLGDITEPHQVGRPVNNDSLVPANDAEDPTESMREDFARDMDRHNNEGQGDDASANHAEDFKPKSGPSYQNRKVDVN